MCSGDQRKDEIVFKKTQLPVLAVLLSLLFLSCPAFGADRPVLTIGDLNNRIGNAYVEQLGMWRYLENAKTPKSIMIAAWKSMDVSYGECCAMMLMDESIFDTLFAALQDGKSDWYLFTADQTEIYHTGRDAGPDPERLISAGKSGTIFRDENNQSICAFSTTMTAPDWTMVRVVSMESSEQVIRRDVGIIAGVVFLIALAIYQLWLKRYMRQFDSLLNGIVRMGQGDLKSTQFEPSSIDEFKRMQQEAFCSIFSPSSIPSPLWHCLPC